VLLFHVTKSQKSGPDISGKEFDLAKYIYAITISTWPMEFRQPISVKTKQTDTWDGTPRPATERNITHVDPPSPSYGEVKLISKDLNDVSGKFKSQLVFESPVDFSNAIPYRAGYEYVNAKKVKVFLDTFKFKPQEGIGASEKNMRDVDDAVKQNVLGKYIGAEESKKGLVGAYHVGFGTAVAVLSIVYYDQNDKPIPSASRYVAHSLSTDDALNQKFVPSYGAFVPTSLKKIEGSGAHYEGGDLLFNETYVGVGAFKMPLTKGEGSLTFDSSTPVVRATPYESETVEERPMDGFVKSLLYPSPVEPNGTMYYKVGGTQRVNIDIYNMAGQVVSRSEFKPNGAEDLLNIPAPKTRGTYIARITRDGQTQTQKITVD
jgi:hypothetical protein